MLRAPTRVLILLLAVVPAVWGTCPKWFAPDVRCCADCRDDASCCTDGCEAEPVSKSPADDRHRDCDGCPVLEVRNGLTPAPAAVTLPPPALAETLAVLAAPEVGTVDGDGAKGAARPADPPGGGPPGLVGTTRLLI